MKETREFTVESARDLFRICSIFDDESGISRTFHRGECKYFESRLTPPIGRKSFTAKLKGFENFTPKPPPYDLDYLESELTPFAISLADHEKRYHEEFQSRCKSMLFNEHVSTSMFEARHWGRATASKPAMKTVTYS